jgi:hypothetical protein
MGFAPAGVNSRKSEREQPAMRRKLFITGLVATAIPLGQFAVHAEVAANPPLPLGMISQPPFAFASGVDLSSRESRALSIGGSVAQPDGDRLYDPVDNRFNLAFLDQNEPVDAAHDRRTQTEATHVNPNQSRPDSKLLQPRAGSCTPLIQFPRWPAALAPLSGHTSEGAAEPVAVNQILWNPQLTGPPNLRAEDLVDAPQTQSREQDSDPHAVKFWNPLGKAWLTREQRKLLALAHRIGLEDGDAHHAELLQAVLLQETIAGQLGRIGHLSAPVGKRSYGVMQVKVSAARDVLRWHPGLGDFRTDEELIVKLMTDDAFNIRIASLYLNSLHKRADSEAEALAAYNLGMRAAQDVDRPKRYKYVRGVHRYLTKLVRPYNDKLTQQTPLRSASR